MLQIGPRPFPKLHHWSNVLNVMLNLTLRLTDTGVNKLSGYVVEKKKSSHHKVYLAKFRKPYFHMRHFFGLNKSRGGGSMAQLTAILQESLPKPSFVVPGGMMSLPVWSPCSFRGSQWDLVLEGCGTILPVNRMTETCKNITFPQLLLWAVKL